MRNLRVVRLAATAAAITVLSACVVVPARHVEAGYPGGGYPSGGYPSAGVYADAAPPAPQYEVVPVVPFVGAVWVTGYWNWYGGRHVWVPGRWSRPHRHGYAWVPHRWVPTPRGWHLQGGHWRG